MVSKEQIKAAFKSIPHVLSNEAHRVTWKELPPVSDEEIKNFDRSKLNGYDRVGYSRPLGGWFYQFFYVLIGAGILAVITPILLGQLYTEPETQAYVTTATVLFSVLQNAFNIPTNWSIERWIGDYRIKNPRKMLEFISFYCWYQMITGVIIIAVTSMYIFYVVIYGALAYLAWLLLLLMTQEYPAMLGVFLQSIRGLQKFDYESKINFMNDIIAKLCEFTFVILGRYVLGANPVIGNLLGTSIGYVIGTYVNNFGSAIISGLYLRRVLRTMGLALTDALRPTFSWDTVKRSTIFGFQLSMPGLISTAVGFFIFFSWYSVVPAYATMLTLSNVADSIANLSKRAEGINTKGAWSEAVNNGKMKLAQYYLANTFKYYGFFTVGIACLIIGYFPTVLSVMLVLGGAQNYLLAIPFILPNILHTLTEQPEGESDKILVMAHKPNFKVLMDLIYLGFSYFFVFLYIYVLRWPQTYGLAAMVWIIPMGMEIPDLFKMLVEFWYIHKYICPVKIAWWQSFVAPVIPGLITLAEGWAWSVWVFPALAATVGPIVAIIISVTFAFAIGLIFNFVILYGAFGGWDDSSLEVFKEAVYISGPSRFFWVPVYKLTVALVKISPLHNKFPLEHEAADREMVELMIQRKKNELEPIETGTSTQ